jgi:hypothetical protein
MRRANLVLFGAGGLGLAACDLMHVKGGVLRHRTGGGPAGQGWWVAPMFGCASLAIAQAARPFLREPRSIAATAPPFVAAYGATALFSKDHPRELTAALWAIGLARTRGDLPFALLLAATGPAVEAATAATGAFTYERPLAEVIPWLAGLYVNGAPLALAVSYLRKSNDARR